MAASSTDGYNNNAPKIPEEFQTNYPVVSVSTEPFWDPSSSSTSPSSEHNWEVDEEEAIKRKIYELKRQFHNGRNLYVKHLPKDATEQDIRELLKDNFIHSIQIVSGTGIANVLLAEPEVLESWSNTESSINGTKVAVIPAHTENVLCIARLPSNYQEQNFVNLLSGFGEINYCFLMISEKTGESKGYGFVQFVNKECAMQAKLALDNRELLDSILVCDWLDSAHITFASLHSKCLYVDRLPKDYRDFTEFRKIFSVVENPIYCQIAMKHGALQDWGLVEFISADDAEETRSRLNNHLVKDQHIRVEYCVPGARAVNLFMKIISENGPSRRQALLPEPPTNKVFLQLKNLTKHNPGFAKSLQNIILTQIQSLQQNQTQASNNSSQLKPPGAPSVRMPACHVNDAVPANYMGPLAQSQSLKPPLNSNAQAALVILLAAQFQQQQGGVNSILSNPQVLNVLQTLVSQGDPHQNSKPSTSNAVSLTSNLKANFRNGYFKNGNKIPKEIHIAENNSFRQEEIEKSVGPLLGGILETQKMSSQLSYSNLLSNLSNPQNLKQLLGTLNHDLTHKQPQLNIPCSIPSQNTSGLMGPPLFEHPVQNPLLSVIMPQQPEHIHSESFLHAVPPPHYLVTSVPSATPQVSWAPHIGPPPIIAHAPLLAGSAPRMISPVFIPHPSVMSPTHPQAIIPGYSTPVGQKRKSNHFLPSPEPSPENGYIGQHSQGLGGHYPDSYSRKKKRF